MTALTKLLDEAVNLHASIRALPTGSGRKLTKAKWTSMAKNLTGMTNAELDAIATKLEGNELAEQSLNSLQRSVCESPHFPTPTPEPKKLLAVCGDYYHAAELASYGVTVLVAQVLAARQSRESKFGTVTDAEELMRQENELHGKFKGCLERIRQSWTAEDLIIDPHVTPNERAAGLARVTFKLDTSIALADPEWPHKLVLVAARKARERKEQVRAAA